MNVFRARAARSLIAAGLGVIAMVAAERPLQARQAEPLLQPTPLVLKDGRIASVSIHVVPFAPGRAELGGEAAARVAELTRVVGTDCFLTAQVIGHIDASEVAQDDTLSAHRLARSRADAVQASLIGGGLPAKAIASVWDWQFMVRAPRATLWIFQLTEGEDCEGQPLDGAMVAQAAPSSSPSKAQAGRAVAEVPAKSAASAVAQAPLPQVGEPARSIAPKTVGPKAEQSQARAETPRAPQALPTPQSTRTATAQPAEQREAGQTVAARPALAPTAPTGDGEVAPTAKQGDRGTAVAAKPAPTAKASVSDKQIEQAPKQRETGSAVAAIPALAPKASASDGKVERGSEGSLVIIFATNSSYFPSGAARRLRELIAGMEPDHKYEVALRVAVSGTTKVVGARSAQEAASYNKWLAERRVERVQNWLLENAPAKALSFKPEFVTDESRQVVVRLAPIG
jgi:outer membrane protein OmpA-like peptidoglycan-associated protein